MKAWVTAEILKRGIEEVNATLISEDAIKFYRANYRTPVFCAGKGTRWHTSKEGAQAKLREFKQNHLAYYEKRKKHILSIK